MTLPLPSQLDKTKRSRKQQDGETVCTPIVYFRSEACRERNTGFLISYLALRWCLCPLMNKKKEKNSKTTKNRPKEKGQRECKRDNPQRSNKSFVFFVCLLWEFFFPPIIFCLRSKPALNWIKWYKSSQNARLESMFSPMLMWFYWLIFLISKISKCVFTHS